MSDGFYRAFEDKHRGTLAQIKNAQRVYLPLTQPLLQLYPQAHAIDLGCGRGEWLELLTESGFDAQGIDLDDGMLAECRARGLKVRTLDAITALKELPDESQAIVSGFHLAEHIPFESLQTLVQEALRVLKPAGLLILETPNPENITVGTANFYLDPTHERPLPPLLLSFLPEYYGFGRVKVLRLQEPVSLTQARRFTIHDVLGGVSPDYAVVAQKTAPSEVLERVSQALDMDYGVTLAAAANQFELGLQSQTESKVNELDIKLNKTLQRVDLALSERLNSTNARIVVAVNELDIKLNLTLQRVDRELNERLNKIDARLNEFEASLSPFIRIGNQIRLLRAQGIFGRTKVISKKVLRVIIGRLIKIGASFPRIKRAMIYLSKKFGVYDRIQSSRRQPSPAYPSVLEPNAIHHLNEFTDEDQNEALSNLPAEVRKAFKELNAEIKKQEKH